MKTTILKKSVKLSLLILLIGVRLNCISQSNDKWRAGSAYSLNDKIYVLTVFISENEWDYGEKLKIYNKIYEAQNWITAQAKIYSKNVKFKNGSYGLNSAVIINNIPVGAGSGYEPTDLASKVLKEVGYISNMQFVNWVKQNTDCTQCLVLIIANKNGISYAIPYSNEMDKEKYFLESCMIYNCNNNGYEFLPSIIAHEMLHLFGAWDLYETFQQSEDREEKAKKLFPNDIMLRISCNINELEIGRLTAWLVGLNSDKKEWYEWFRPKYY